MSIFATTQHSTIDNLLNNFHIAASVGHLEDYFGCFLANATFLGTDKTENWSVEQFLEFSRPHFINGGWKYTPKSNSRKIIYFNDQLNNNYQFATFDELLDSTSFIATSRGSGTVAWDSNKSAWYIASYHLTFPIPNDLAKKICKDIAKYEELEISKQKEYLANKATEELFAELNNEQTINNNKNKKSTKKR